MGVLCPRSVVTCVVAALTVCGSVAVFAQNEAPWSYDDTGAWPSSFPHCGGGNSRPSPVDFAQVPIDLSLRMLPTDYGLVSAFTTTVVPRRSVTVTIDPVIAPSIADPASTHFLLALRSVDVFTPSLHTFGGAHRDLEIHLVHESTDPLRTTTVVAITFRVTSGAGSNDPLRVLTGPALAPSNGTARRSLRLADLTPVQRDYYVYDGSQPHPPCRPGVRYYVYSDPVGIAEEQLLAIRRALGFSTTLEAALLWQGQQVAAALPGGPLRGLDGNYRPVSAVSDPTRALLDLAATRRGAGVPTGGGTPPPVPGSTPGVPVDVSKSYAELRGIWRYAEFVGDEVLLTASRPNNFNVDVWHYAAASAGVTVSAFVIGFVAWRLSYA